MTEPQLTYSMAAEEALQRSIILAGKHKQEYATTPSLLHALVEEPRCDASKTLQATDVNLRKLRRSIGRFKSVNGDGGRQTNADGQPTQMSSNLYRVLASANTQAIRDDAPQITTRDLLLGTIDQADIALSTLLHEQGVDANLIRAKAPQVNELVPLPDPKAEKRNARAARPRFMVSPIFLVLVLITIVTGYVLYAMPQYADYALFVFIVAGWIVSLALHEFGHALAAYFGGDYSVVDKGYLTLNPLNYTHGMLSIVMPVVILLMGGIGLPGGAVYINRAAIRSPLMNTVVSAAGPFTNMLFAALLVVIYYIMDPGFMTLNLLGLGLLDPDLLDLEILDLSVRGLLHLDFWAGLGLLIFLQVTAILLNLLPVPGLDGFGIIAPWLPPGVLQMMAPFYNFGFIILIALFWYSEAFSSWFWSMVMQILVWMNVDPSLAVMGLDTFMFWK